MEAVDDPVPVWLLTPDNCADGDDADDSAGGNEQVGDHRSDSGFSIVVPSLSSRNAGLDRCGEWDSASSLDWSKRSTDLTNIVVSVCVPSLSTRPLSSTCPRRSFDETGLFEDYRREHGRSRGNERCSRV